MSGADKTVYRVMQIVGHDAAVICEIRDGDAKGGKIRETKDSRIVLGGVDSFWLLTGEKKEQKAIVERGGTRPLPSRFSSVSSLSASTRASSVFERPGGFDLGSSGGHGAVSFASVTRLAVAYSSRDISDGKLVSLLREGKLPIPLEKEVVAIEVRPSTWLTTQFERKSSGLYGLSVGTSARAVPVRTLENRPETIRLSSGLIVFVGQPRWSSGDDVDLRPEEEILESAEYWLARAKAASDFQSGSDASLVDLLRQQMASTVDAEERADLSAVIGLLSDRQPLIELVFQIMAREPAFQEKLSAFEQAEKDRLRTALLSRLDEELRSEQIRLSGIRAELVDAETKLALVSHREALLRSEAEKHDHTIRARITEAARNLSEGAKRDGRQLREEVERLRDMVTELVRPKEHIAEIVDPSMDTQQEGYSAPMLIADENARRSIIGSLSSATAMPVADMVSIILRSTEDIPVLIGPKSSAAAADIAAAIGGDDCAIVFCDPSRISWQDLLRDETSGLAAAVARARAHPEVLVPVALCGITNGPCEYWVPQFAQSRRLGKMPRNLGVIASAGMDGMRVSVPDSVLEYFVPVIVPASSTPARNLFAGAWRTDREVDQEKLSEALDLLAGPDGVENGVLPRLVKTLSRTPAGIDMKGVAAAFLRHEEWITSLSHEDRQHEFDAYFKNIGG